MENTTLENKLDYCLDRYGTCEENQRCYCNKSEKEYYGN